MKRSSIPRRARALLLAGLLAAAAPPLFAAGGREHGVERTISVSGSGTVSAAPDLAVVRLGVETRSADVKQALAEAAARIAAISRSLERNGVAQADIRTVDYNVGFIAEPRPPASAGGQSLATPPAGYFRVTDVASVTVRDLANLGSILDGALGAGANEVEGIAFRLSDPAPLEKKARAAAYAEAHDRALQLAALSGNVLGKVLQIGSSSSPVPFEAGGLRAAAFAAPAVSPGTLDVTVTVQVVYAIK